VQINSADGWCRLRRRASILGPSVVAGVSHQMLDVTDPIKALYLQYYPLEFSALMESKWK
jgi:hypothetical protein